MEQWIERHEVFAGPVFRAYTGTVRLDDGQTARRDVVSHRGGVAVVPIHGDEVLLVRQFRIGAGLELVELPAGLREPDEPPEATAQRELAEELGYHAGRLIPLTTYYTSPGYADERTAIFLALDLQLGPANPDWDERLHPVNYRLADLPAALAAGAFPDGKTQVGLYAALAWLAREAASIDP
ncbi:MAG: NUDIX hydrolase [Oscillochloridaceae bacterium umkhey_bin13]